MARENIKRNIMKFELIDNTGNGIFNESCKMERSWYGQEDDGQVMSIETYYIYCKQFAATMGFSEKTINEWFGDY